MTNFNSKKLFAALAVGLLAISGIVACAGTGGDFGAGATDDEGTGTTEEVAEKSRESTVPSQVSNAPQGKLAIDSKDERQIVGRSTDVFFGRVVEQSGSEGAPTTKPGFEEPQTQYAVQVSEVIKGDASGVLTVNQLGGYADDGHPDFPEVPGGDSLLEPGQEYLFATKYVEEKGWYQIVLPGAANVEVEDEAQRQELKQKFEEAEANHVKVSIPSGAPTPEEIEKRSYRHCWPYGSNPRGADLACDPSDPLPPGKSKYSSGEPG